MTTFWGPDFDELRSTDPEIAAVIRGELDRLAMDLPHGGHLTHGSKAGVTGRAVQAEPDTDSGRAVLADVASEVADLVAKFPAYPR